MIIQFETFERSKPMKPFLSMTLSVLMISVPSVVWAAGHGAGGGGNGNGNGGGGNGGGIGAGQGGGIGHSSDVGDSHGGGLIQGLDNRATPAINTHESGEDTVPAMPGNDKAA